MLELIFLSILGAFFVLALVTVILGDIFDLGETFFGEVGEIGHDLGDFGADVEMDSGIDLGSDLDFHTPSFLSSRTIFSGLTVFGAAGFIAANQGASAIGSVLIALAGMVGGMLLMYFGVILPMAKQQGSDRVLRSNWVGLDAQVTSAIPAGGLGKVSFYHEADGALHSEAAQTEDGGALAQGTSVIITQVGASRVIVEPKPRTS